MSLIQSLVLLNVDDNELESLPSDFRFPNLTELSAEGNRLQELPESISECKELQVLALGRNNFTSHDFATFATQLPKLRTLSTDVGSKSPFDDRI